MFLRFKSLVGLWHTTMITPSCLWRYLTCPTKKFQRVSSGYGQPVRTNNYIEGWHNSLNRRAGGRVHLPFYLLIQLLHRESSVCTVQLRLVNARKLQRIQRKKYRALQALIFGYWEDYAGSKISSRRFLKACFHLAKDQFEQIRFRSLLVLYCYSNYSSFSFLFLFLSRT